MSTQATKREMSLSGYNFAHMYWENAPMTTETLDALDWRIRLAVYHFIVAHARAPSAGEIATALGIDAARVQMGLERLHARHALLLDADNTSIRMANPLSGVPTPFRTHVGEHTYFANCAWDSLGIPAALHVDARVEAACAQSGEKIYLTVQNQGTSTERSVQGSSALVHFLVPFKDWYDDLPFT